MREQIIIEFKSRRIARKVWRHHRKLMKKHIEGYWEKLEFTFPKGSKFEDKEQYYGLGSKFEVVELIPSTFDGHDYNTWDTQN